MHPSEANEHREIPCRVGSTRALEQILLSDRLVLYIQAYRRSEEAAHVLGVPQGTVKAQLARARSGSHGNRSTRQGIRANKQQFRIGTLILRMPGRPRDWTFDHDASRDKALAPLKLEPLPAPLPQAQAV